MLRCLLALVLTLMCHSLAFGQGPLKPVNLDKVNTPKDEDDPFLTSDRLRLYYCSNADERYHLFVAERKSVSQPWPRGKVVEGTAGENHDRSPYVTSDQHDLFFATSFSDKESAGNFDLVRAIAIGKAGQFTAPVPIQPACTPADELHPWLSGDGKDLYFSRKIREGWRVFVSSRTDTKSGFGESRLVESLPVGFHHATLSRDGRVMYLQGPLENNRWGLFRSTRPGGAGAWTKPEALTGLNNPEGPVGDTSPSLTSDAAKLYFASDRPRGKGGLDLWVIDTSLLRK